MNYAHDEDERMNVKIHHYILPHNQKKGVLFYATRDIPEFEELRWNYQDPVCKELFDDSPLEE